MASDKLRIYTKAISLIVPYALHRLRQRFEALYHRWTFTLTSSPQNVVVVGGSFAGLALARRLAESLPSGYRVVLIEKNSHFNYSFVFPRSTVLQGQEKRAFIPYDHVARDAPKGIFERVQDTATHITDRSVHLLSGSHIDYSYMAVATGTSQALPGKVSSPERREGWKELRGLQDKIQNADRIAIVGGGAVGIEMTTDIKTFFPEKKVTLIHSRSYLLPSFGRKLSDHVLEQIQKFGVNVILNERPVLPEQRQGAIQFADGRVQEFDLIIPCTGQRPNSDIVADMLPESVSAKTGRILVQPTLQIVAKDNGNMANVFALGDVAETGGPKMARAGEVQADVVASNIVNLIRGRGATKVYKPQVDFEGALKLPLGKTDWVVYIKDDAGVEMLVAGDGGKKDLEIGHAWKEFNADPAESKCV